MKRIDRVEYLVQMGCVGCNHLDRGGAHVGYMVQRPNGVTRAAGGRLGSHWPIALDGDDVSPRIGIDQDDWNPEGWTGQLMRAYSVLSGARASWAAGDYETGHVLGFEDDLVEQVMWACGVILVHEPRCQHLTRVLWIALGELRRAGRWITTCFGPV